MNPIDKQLMMGMIDILNNHSDILTKDQINIRLEDLKQFEEESNFAFINSPTYKDKISSIVKYNSNIYKNNFNKCHEVNNIIEFSNQKDMLVYLNIVGENITITYINGIIDHLIIDNALINLNEVKNIPYKISKKSTYIINGVLHNSTFYVINVDDNNVNLKDSLDKAKEIGFDIIPHWLATNFDPKNLQSNLEYVYDYAEEEGFKYDGIVFRFNDISYSQDGIVYEMLNK